MTLTDDRIGEHGTNENNRVRHGESDDNFEMYETRSAGSSLVDSDCALFPRS